MWPCPTSVVWEEYTQLQWVEMQTTCQKAGKEGRSENSNAFYHTDRLWKTAIFFSRDFRVDKHCDMFMHTQILAV